MDTEYPLTLTQAKVLRALGKTGEMSAAEIAVHARLMPQQVNAAVAALEKVRFVNFWVTKAGQTGQRIVALTSEGQTVQRALSQFPDAPPVGTIVAVQHTPSVFSGWVSGQMGGSGVAHVLVTPDEVVR
jgi:hypothetical protein